jgi:hypothetical protein
MSQRNPMNDRYQSEDRKGLTRKSAASLKPKSKAAASVRIETKTKTPQQKKAEKKAERAKQAELDRQYYNPPTEEYKLLRLSCARRFLGWRALGSLRGLV